MTRTTVSVFSPKDILLAIAKYTDLEIGRKLGDSGLNTQGLKQVVKTGKRRRTQNQKEI